MSEQARTLHIKTITSLRGTRNPGAPVEGDLTQPQANQFITALSQLLEDVGPDWADRIVITVS